MFIHIMLVLTLVIIALSIAGIINAIKDIWQGN